MGKGKMEKGKGKISSKFKAESSKIRKLKREKEKK